VIYEKAGSLDWLSIHDQAFIETFNRKLCHVLSSETPQDKVQLSFLQVTNMINVMTGSQPEDEPITLNEDTFNANSDVEEDSKETTTASKKVKFGNTSLPPSKGLNRKGSGTYKQ
jgi:hypothetical protein